MTPIDPEKLCERLESKTPAGRTATGQDSSSWGALVNPDGPEAAAEIRSLLAQVRALEDKEQAAWRSCVDAMFQSKRLTERATAAEATCAELRGALTDVLPYLEEGYLEDEPDDEPVGWTADPDGTNQRPMLLTFGMVRRARALAERKEA
jgi:hypothetical protein